MRLILPLVLLVAGPADARETLGQFGRWGAFRDGAHCYAVSQPAKARDGTAVTLSSSPARGVRIQFHATLSRAATRDRPVTLRVGSWALPLVAKDRDAWAADARADLRILAAIRGRDLLAIVGTDARGRRFTDRYVLAGAASAADAALIGCIAP